jgi:hypothetical protein
MNKRDYTLFLEGYKAAERGAGLSGDPYGGTDGALWRRGVAFWLDGHPDQDGRPPAQENTAQDAPGRAISTPPLSGHGREYRLTVGK